MARGREAVRAARQRQAAANTAVDHIKTELTDERERHRLEESRLQSEIARLKNNIWHEASQMAQEEIRRKLEQAEKERRDRGISDSIVYTMMYNKDRLIYNACKYISMTEGKEPGTALAMVLTWCTDKDIHGLTRDKGEFFIELGVPVDAWCARAIKDGKHWEKTRSGRSNAVSLAHAIEQDHPDIHPLFKKWGRKWYPEVTYPKVVIEDLQDETTEEAS